MDSLLAQTLKPEIIVVDNGSVDDSVKIIEKHYPEVHLIKHSRNKGFAGGVNAGIRYAMEQGAEYVALLNNDAVADKDWLKYLSRFLDKNTVAGIITSKIVESNRTSLDSTGECYSIWGLPFARGRGEEYSDKCHKDTWVFGASGGASLYRTKMLEAIGLFDEDFFAYYEDVDISFRAQLAGWKVGYEPKAVVYHEIGATSSQIKGFTTYQTMKNLPMLWLKNVPKGLFWRVGWRLRLALFGFFASAVARGQGWPAFRGAWMAVFLSPKKIIQRRRIQKNRKVSVDYINSIITHDLPPNARSLSTLRQKWWRMRGKG